MKYKYSKYFFIGLFIIILLLSFFVVKELIIPILLSIILAYFFYPVYRFLNRYIKNRSICSLVMILILLLIVAIPLIFIIPVLVKESLSIYNYLSNLNITNLNPLIMEGINKGVLSFVGSISKFILTVPSILINLFITLFILYYLFKDGEKILQNIRDMIPLDDKHKDTIVREFKQVTNGVAYGLMLVGLIDGILAAIGFYIFNVSNPIFWGLIVMILAILPALGASLVWAPLGIIKLINYDTFNGIGILIYGFFILSGVETFLRPKLIGDKTKLHPIIIIVGVMGGLKFFGLVGIIFGPFILVILTTMFKFLVIKK